MNNEREQIKKVNTLSLVLTSANRTICNLYNAEGGLLVKEGSMLPEKVKKMAVYAPAQFLPEDDKEELDYTLDPDEEEALYSFSGTCENPEQERKKEKLAKHFGENLVKFYDNSVKQIEYIFKRSYSPQEIVRKTTEIIRNSMNQDRYALSKCIFTLRDKDTYTFNHCMSVYTIMMQALEDFRDYQNEDIFWDTFKQQHAKVNFTKNTLAAYGLGALLHDLGKAQIPEQILNKPGKLSDKEFLIMQQHVVYGVKMLKEAKIDDPHILQLVGNHHPAYPVFRQVVHSPLVTILNIIDIYDAMRSKRVYKDGVDWNATRQILEQERIKYEWNSFIFETIVNKMLNRLEEHHLEVEI